MLEKKSVDRLVIRAILLFIFPALVQANNLHIENVRFIHRPQSTDEMRAIFDLSWHNAKNHDAAWVFLKFVYPTGVSNVINVANGRYFGGSMWIAPNAQQFSCFIEHLVETTICV